MTEQIFVVGAGRSGTSLIQSIFSSHDDIYFFPETGFLRRLVFSGNLDKLFNSVNVEALSTFLSADHRICRLGLSYQQIYSCVLQSSQVTDSAPYLYKLLLANHLNHLTYSYYGDKDPRLLEHLDLLYQTFPGCKVIHVKRNLFDVISSRMNAQWSQKYSFSHHLLIALYQSSLPRSKVSLSSSNYISIIYEDLLSDPLCTLNTVLNFLGLSHFSCLPDHSSESTRLVANSERQWKSKTFEPLDSSNVNQWIHTLSPYQVTLLHIFLQPESPSLVYGVDYSKVEQIVDSINPLVYVMIYLYSFFLKQFFNLFFSFSRFIHVSM